MQLLKGPGKVYNYKSKKEKKKYKKWIEHPQKLFVFLLKNEF